MIENYDTMIMFTIFGLPINATLFYSWVVMLILVVLSKAATYNLKTTLKVSKFQTALESIVMVIRNQVRDISNDNPIKYLPIIGTFFLYIGMSNLLTIIPWFKPPTGSLSTTAAFSLCVFFAMPYYGIKNAGLKKYLMKYLDPSPIMLPMNILSDFSSVFSLAVRLYGNVLSASIIASVLMMLTPFLLPLPLQILGLVTGMIQAYIFALLAIVYVSSVQSSEPFVDHLKEY
ncbi:MAG: F0F1 ATP synthase subunit A [Lactobacillales bacterium]|jgi:F-type H+-transporting ATPase subunit a|nr:F0F1 ATP synthase subunit A [Lactobacillales bacterium]